MELATRVLNLAASDSEGREKRKEGSRTTCFFGGYSSLSAEELVHHGKHNKTTRVLLNQSAVVHNGSLIVVAFYLTSKLPLRNGVQVKWEKAKKLKAAAAALPLGGWRSRGRGDREGLCGRAKARSFVVDNSWRYWVSFFLSGKLSRGYEVKVKGGAGRGTQTDRTRNPWHMSQLATLPP